VIEFFTAHLREDWVVSVYDEIRTVVILDPNTTG
jgi:hypothetical protein